MTDTSVVHEKSIIFVFKMAAKTKWPPNLRRYAGSEPHFSLLICYSYYKMLFNAFYGIEKYAFVFDWWENLNHDSFIILYNIWDKNRNCKKTKKSRFDILCGQYSTQNAQILIHAIFWYYPTCVPPIVYFFYFLL